MSTSQVHASASHSVQETRELLSRVKSDRGCFPVVGLGAFDGLAQPSTDRKPAKSGGKGRKVRGKENLFLRKVENRQAWVHLAFGQNHKPHVPSLVLRCPRSVRLRLAQLVVDHITLHVFVLISACCVSTSWKSCFRMSQQKESDCILTWQTGIWYPCSAVFDAP